MEPLFNRKRIPKLQEIFDRLYFYNQEAERLFALATSGKAREKKIAIQEARDLRKIIHNEYHEMNLVANEKYYKEYISPPELYPEYKHAIADMNKFAGNLSYRNLNSYLYDVSDYATYGLFSCRERFINGGIDTNGFFDSDNELEKSKE